MVHKIMLDLTRHSEVYLEKYNMSSGLKYLITNIDVILAYK